MIRRAIASIVLSASLVATPVFYLAVLGLSAEQAIAAVILPIVALSAWQVGFEN